MGVAFTQVHTALIRDPSLSNGAFRLFCVIQSYAWQDGYCWPGEERLAKDVGVSVRTIRNWLAELRKRMVWTGEPTVEVETKGHSNTKTNFYRTPHIEEDVRTEAQKAADDAATGKILPLTT